MLERFFRLAENNTTVQREIAGGVTTFMTMAYIVFVQPVVMNAAGIDLGAAMVATCVSSAVATFLMGLIANYPVALAPAMGHNFFFTYTVVLVMGYTWQQALGAVFLASALFLALSLFGLRERLLNEVPNSLKHAIAVGIGLLIAAVGLEWCGLVVDNPGTLVGMGRLNSPPVLLALFGLSLMVILLALRVRAAMLIGIAATWIVALLSGMVKFEGVVGSIPSLRPTFLKLDLAGILRPEMIHVVFIFFFLALFDTVGTLIGVSQEAGLVRPDGTLPRARQALFSDATGTTLGALLGTSTVTSYIESAAGVSAGARTGLANMATGVLLLLSIFFSPLVRMVGGGIEYGDGLRLYPIIAPALIVVGCFMMKNVVRIKWDDFGEAIPAFLVIIIMPLTFSITEGIAFGFISFTLIQLARGNIRKVPMLITVFSALFVLRYIFL